ncbi:MAG TPA: hypothetical protein VN442_17160 [Bryobacteraceae bacterium]|nr:hypothetical protein [Bryobacteraceae bacterium]
MSFHISNVGSRPGKRTFSLMVRFTLTPEVPAVYDQNMVRRVGPGTFNVTVGSASDQIRLSDSFEVRQCEW